MVSPVRCDALAAGPSAWAVSIEGPFVPGTGSWTLINNGNFESHNGAQPTGFDTYSTNDSEGGCACNGSGSLAGGWVLMLMWFGRRRRT